MHVEFPLQMPHAVLCQFVIFVVDPNRINALPDRNHKSESGHACNNETSSVSDTQGVEL